MAREWSTILSNDLKHSRDLRNQALPSRNLIKEWRRYRIGFPVGLEERTLMVWGIRPIFQVVVKSAAQYFLLHDVAGTRRSAGPELGW